MLPAIVLPAFNRPHALKRLLDSILQGEFEDAGGPVPLVISLEGDADPECQALAREVAWPHGPKRVIQHPRHMGLRDHILACGDLSATYGAVVVLEDDLLVSPGFYAFARQAAAFYAQEPRIGGVSLYTFIFNEFGGFPFEPLDDGLDMYFIQSASSWGQVWTADQWAAFRAWLDAPGALDGLAQDVRLPEEMRGWPDGSWKKLFNAYLVDRGLYFAVPRTPLSTNLCDKGTHFLREWTHYTHPLAIGRRDIRFTGPDASLCRYDAFFELEAESFRKLTGHALPEAFTVDFHGIKPLELLRRMPWALTIRAQKAAQSSFKLGLRLLPPELNARFAISGDFYALVPSDQVMQETPREKTLAIRRFFNPPELSGEHHPVSRPPKQSWIRRLLG